MPLVLLEPAFVLHRRPFSNTSLIVELFTLNHGRVSALAKSARGLKSRYKGGLELFFPLVVSWTGQRELKLLGPVELSGIPYLLDGKALLCGFYLNELLMRLLHKEDPYPNLFRAYQDALNRLVENHSHEMVLRIFEKHLLNELGYGLPLQHDMESKLPIEANHYYQYLPDRGFLRCEDNSEPLLFIGESLLALRDENFSHETSLNDVKRLMRLAINRLLGSKPLKSRELW